MTHPAPIPPAGAPMLQPPPPVQVPVVAAAPDSRLEQLLALYSQYKPLADDYAQKLKAVTDGIKVELTLAAPGHNKVKVDSPELERPLQLTAVEKTYVDSKRMRIEDPALFKAWSKVTVTWELRRSA